MLSCGWNARAQTSSRVSLRALRVVLVLRMRARSARECSPCRTCRHGWRRFAPRTAGAGMTWRAIAGSNYPASFSLNTRGISRSKSGVRRQLGYPRGRARPAHVVRSEALVHLAQDSRGAAVEAKTHFSATCSRHRTNQFLANTFRIEDAAPDDMGFDSGETTAQLDCVVLRIIERVVDEVKAVQTPGGQTSDQIDYVRGRAATNRSALNCGRRAVRAVIRAAATALYGSNRKIAISTLFRALAIRGQVRRPSRR